MPCIDRGKMSDKGLILGPCITEEINGALWPIYGTRLGGQYSIGLPLLITAGGSMVSSLKRKKDVAIRVQSSKYIN
jgi:hypothetical protein